MGDGFPPVERHKTAIRRRDVSVPVKCACRDGLLNDTVTFFDYGCGHGEDLSFLVARGINCEGWDPVFRPDSPRSEADVVNLGYVINVIEDLEERADTLRHAWELCRNAMVVSAQIVVSGRGNKHVTFGDGVLTRRGTFQKFYTQNELRSYISSVLKEEPLPASLGVFYVFKSEELRQQFLASRFRRTSGAPRQCLSEARFETHKDLLAPLIEAVQQLGRLPAEDEFDFASEVIEEFGSLKRAFALVRRVTGNESWVALENQRRDDLLVYLALSRFRTRPVFSRLPAGLQRDIRAFFGAYTKACRQADELLFLAGDADAVDKACRESSIGKLLPNALYVHRSALESLAPPLRIYEGCGRAYLGELEGVNIIKIHRYSGKISYLEYRDFDADPHPALVRSYKLAMRTQHLNCLDYTDSENPPILHRKETLVEPEHPLYDRFARLTRQEEKHGLLDDPRSIGTRKMWEARLRENGFMLRGHRLVRKKTDVM